MPAPTTQEIQAEMTRFGINEDVAIGNLLMRQEQSAPDALALSSLSAQTGLSPGVLSSSLARTTLTNLGNQINELSQHDPTTPHPIPSPTPGTAPATTGTGTPPTQLDTIQKQLNDLQSSIKSSATTDQANAATTPVTVFGSTLNVTADVAANIQARGVFERGGIMYTRDSAGNEIVVSSGLSDEFQGMQQQQLAIARAREAELRSISNEYALRISETEETQQSERAKFRNFLITQGFVGGTDAPSVLGSVDKAHRDEIGRLELQKSIALDKARAAFADLDFKAAQAFVEEARSIRKEQAERDRQRRQDLLDIDRMMLDLSKEQRAKATEERQATNQQRDDARAVITNVLNSFGGAAIETLPDEIKAQFSALEVQAGYPAGFVTSGLRNLRETSFAQTKELAEARASDKKAQDDIMNQIRLAQLGIAQARLEISRDRADKQRVLKPLPITPTETSNLLQVYLGAGYSEDEARSRIQDLTAERPQASLGQLQTLDPESRSQVNQIKDDIKNFRYTRDQAVGLFPELAAYF